MTLVEKTSESRVSHEKSLTVAILIFNGVEIIDFSGPWEVFGAAGFKVHTVASGPGPIKTVFGEKLIPDYTLENSPQADIVLVPGGSIAPAMNDARVIEWIQTRAKEAKYVMSVCNGAFLLAKAGLLDGLSATTVRGGIDRLAKVAHRGRRSCATSVMSTTASSSRPPAFPPESMARCISSPRRWEKTPRRQSRTGSNIAGTGSRSDAAREKKKRRCQ